MDLVDSYSQIAFNKRDIKTFPIISHNDLVILNILFEFLEVVTLDIMKNGPAVIQGNGRDGVSPFIQSGCFYIQKCSGMTKMRK